MANLLISGALGKMGKKVYEAAINSSLSPIAGVDIKQDFSNDNFKIYDSFNNVSEKIDVVIDFSSPKNLDNLLNFCLENNVNAVLCTTGYTESDLEKIEKASSKIAIFRSFNMSLGVNVLISAVKHVAKSLYGFDIEIIEKHHNKKVDSPSGTALMLADAVKSELPEKYYVYGREGIVGARDKNEVGIHAIRGGNIVGEHQVVFAGENETLTFTHQATDRGVFAIGAVNAAIYICGKNAGIYNMDNLIKG
ncbi:MAG: 4-hydroxy-tetrahydrodipicolinate reductase [Clostridia bacterium]|nr:4-hydroxy-tetrahydrodipicolinate reductase [Clostridia bacterium]